MIKTETPFRPEQQTDVLALRCDPIPVVRVGFIGLGIRGMAAVKRFLSIDGVEIKAICDTESRNLDEVRNIIAQHNRHEAKEFAGREAWKDVCAKTDIDLIYICTDWLTHTPIAVYAMEHGKHVAVEVPAATTVAECWQLVDTAEKTRRHCMMLENCCYDRFELATLNMAQHGLFGEIVHVEGAYIHDLRALNWNVWRTDYCVEHTGNPYPTHGLGPVCQLLNIHRGDKMNYLVSVSSGQFGITDFAEKTFGNESAEAKQTYKMGDMNTTIIKTEKGKTMMIQHNVTNPRPYSRIYLVSGTNGFAMKYPLRQLALNSSEALSEEQMDAVLFEYDHPFFKAIGGRAAQIESTAHGRMSYIMDSRLVYCLRHGLPLDQDVYDAAEWSCLVALTEISVENMGAPVEIPDFTRGGWSKPLNTIQ